MVKHPAIFLDRDGTLIEDVGYISQSSQIRFYPSTFEALKILQRHFLLFIITNQSGIAKGFTTEQEVQNINKMVVSTLKAKNIAIYDVFCCPHKNEDHCDCKKPKTHFIDKAKALYHVDLSKSYIIGDHPSDVYCGLNAGITPIYLLTGHGKNHQNEIPPNTEICKHILDAAKSIIFKMNQI